MNPIDSALHAAFGLLPAPRYEPFRPLQVPGERLIVAENGLFLEMHQPWCHVLVQVGQIAIRVPYGRLEEQIRCLIPPIPLALIRQFDQAARAAALAPCPHELGGAIIWQEGAGFRLDFHEPLESGADYLRQRRANLTPTEHLVVDCHSHARHPAFFSVTDDRDDQSGVKLAYVVGQCDQPQPSRAWRWCARGHFMPVSRGLFDGAWQDEHGADAARHGETRHD